MILVTGGTGLVGSHLLYHLLLEDEPVKAIYQKNSDVNAVKRVFSYYTSDYEKFFNKIIWVEASLNDVPALENVFKLITRVYHCAALVSFDPAEYKIMRRVNIDGTSNIVNLCITNAIEKLCFVSSVAAVEKKVSESKIDESENWNSAIYKSGYAITKYGAEMEVWRASQEGIDVVIVNPGVILGSGFWQKGTGNLFTEISKGFKFYTEGVTGFVGVIDLVKIMQKLMQSDIKNERFIVVAQNTSFKNIFYTIADSLHKKRPKVKITKPWSEIFWRLDILRSKIMRKSPLLTKNSARASQSKNYYTSKKLKTVLNFKFENINHTIQNIAKNFKQDNLSL